MSLGFLTESALIPRKSKDIKVDKSAVGVIAEHEIIGGGTQISDC